MLNNKNGIRIGNLFNPKKKKINFPRGVRKMGQPTKWLSIKQTSSADTAVTTKISAHYTEKE